MKKFSLLLTLVCFTLTAFAQEHMPKTYLEFNGVNQYLSVEKNEAFKTMEQGDMTLTLWFKGDRTITYAPTQRLISSIVQTEGEQAKAFSYELLAMKNMKNNFLALRNTNLLSESHKFQQKDIITTQTRKLGSWYYLAYVVDRTNKVVRLTINGRETYTMPIKAKDEQLPSADELIIACGMDKNKAYAHFGGALDNIRFYDKALSQEEVLNDMNRELVTAYTPHLFAGFDLESYQVGDSEVNDVKGLYKAKLHNYPSKQEHKLVQTYAQHNVNGNLIGRGKGQALGGFTLGLKYPDFINRLSLELNGSFTKKDIKALRLYATSNGDRYDMRDRGVLLAETYEVKQGTNLLGRVANAPKLDRHSKLWLVAEVSDKAKEGCTIQAQVKEIKLATASFPPFKPQTQPLSMQEIVLTRQLVWAPKENKSAHYRIPAIVYLENGSLVASIDKRKNSEYDLPEDIDVEVKISNDLGKTWSKPITVAKGIEGHGFGDAGIATDGKNIYMVMVAGSGLWFYPSSAKKPLEMYFAMSEDGGKTWTKPREITEQVYTNRYPNGGFFGSGNGIVMKNGRIAFVAAMRINSQWGGQMDNVVVYSDDKGKTWHSSPVARANGDESKIEELADGRLLISSRNRLGGANARTFVLSSDGGETWSKPATWQELMGNACNAGFRRYTKGYEHKSWAKGKEEWLLHTLPSSDKREKLRIYLSQDNGKTWPISREICHGEAVYSEIAILSDGTIALISEENDRPGFDIYYTHITMDWLLNGERNYDCKK